MVFMLTHVSIQTINNLSYIECDVFIRVVLRIIVPELGRTQEALDTLRNMFILILLNSLRV